MIRTLNSLRFILVLMIMVSHSALPISQAFHDYLGEYPVAIFFTISGFVLSLTYGERLRMGKMSNWHFILTRIFKLYPFHLLILAVTIPLDGRLGYLGPWYQTMAHVLLLQCWIPTRQFVFALNAPTWFVSDLISFYLVFKYLYRWVMQVNKAVPLWTIGICMMAYLALTVIVEDDRSADYIYFYPPFRMIDFSLGILAYRFYRSDKGKAFCTFVSIRLKTWQAHLADLAVVMMSAGMYCISVHVIPNSRCSALYWLPSVLLVSYFVASDQGRGWLTCLFHTKTLSWLGGISFEIFICHSLGLRMLQSIFLRIFGEEIPYLGLQFVLALGFILLMSWAGRKYFAVPCYQYLRKRIG